MSILSLDKSVTATAVLSENSSEGKIADATLDQKKASNVAIDMSLLNIAKPFSIGHSRSTVIWDALAKIIKQANPVKINHLGDWGKQFGMLIVAYKKYGNEAVIRQNPISQLLKLTRQINAEAADDPTVDVEARDGSLTWNGDAEALGIVAMVPWWISGRVDRIYTELGVEFDSMKMVKTFYNDKMDEIIDILSERSTHKYPRDLWLSLKVLKAQLLIKKSDGAMLYITRDLAAALLPQTDL